MQSNESSLQPLSPSEWLLLSCVYALGSGTAFDVQEEMGRRYQDRRSPDTIGVLLARVASKGYLQATPVQQARGRPLHRYTPVVSRQAALSRVLDGICDNYRLSKDELRCTLLEEHEAVKR